MESFAREIEQVVCYKCPQCDFVSLDKDKVSEHLNCKHDKPNIPVYTPDITDPSSPDDCQLDETVTQVESNSKSSKKKFSCRLNSCSARFLTESSLKYHTDCHFYGSQYLKCPDCGEIKKTWQAMAMHLWKSHTVNVELLSCDLCTYKTGNKELLKFHIKTHSDLRTCLCDECGKGLKNMKQLRNHKVIDIFEFREISADFLSIFYKFPFGFPFSTK